MADDQLLDFNILQLQYSFENFNYITITQL